MIGLAGDRADRVAPTASRGGVWLVLIALLLGGVLALAPAPRLPPDGRTVLTATGFPWGTAKLPEPQAQSGKTLTSAVIPVSRWKPSSSPWPKTATAAIPAAVSRQPQGRRAAARRRARGTLAARSPRRLAYDPHGPPFPTR